jgi:hypothetical protein
MVRPVSMVKRPVKWVGQMMGTNLRIERACVPPGVSGLRTGGGVTRSSSLGYVSRSEDTFGVSPRTLAEKWRWMGRVGTLWRS